MTEPILDPTYWRRRLKQADLRHRAIFRCSLEKWEKIEDKHKDILHRLIRPNDSILDIGCGWGRLLNLLPWSWRGEYLGIDLSPDFVELARQEHPGRNFVVGDALHIEELRKDFPVPRRTRFHWAIMVSFRPMIQRNLGGEAWDEIQRVLSTAAAKMLFLEFDENDDGSIE